jgi:hypothetical protein
MLHAQSSTTATILRPYITSISPEVLVTGVDSTVLTINGRRFQRGASVFFSARKLTNVRIDGDSVIVAVIPGELTTYPDVAVLMIENPDETKIGMRVRIRSVCGGELPFEPEVAPSTTSATMQAFRLTITNGVAQDFKLNARLFLNASPLSIIYNDGRTLIADVPAILNTTGTYVLQLVPENVCFNRIYAIGLREPAITRVTPNPPLLNSIGGKITILGVNFSTLATVGIGGTTLAIVSISETQIVAVVPPNLSPRNFVLYVINPDGQVATQTFARPADSNNAQPAPAIRRLLPNTAGSGDYPQILTIEGSNFSTQAVVRLGQTILSIQSISSNRIIVNVPPILPGLYQLSVTNPDNSSTSQTWGVVVGVVNVTSTTTLYPNPTTTALTLETTLDRAAMLTLTLRNVMGAPVLEERHTAASGRFATTLDVSALASGVYVLEVSDGAGRWAQKVVKY